MKSFSLRSLRVQAILWTFLPLTAIFLIVGFVGHTAYGEVVDALILYRNEELARLNAERLSDNLENHARILQMLAAHPKMARFESPEQDDVYTSTLKLGHLKNFDAWVALFDKSGKMVKHDRSKRIEVNDGLFFYAQEGLELGDFSVASEDFFKEPRTPGEVYFSDIMTGPNGKLLTVISVPIFDNNGRFNGVLAGGFLVNGKRTTFEDWLGAENSYLVDRRGRVIWHSREELRGEYLTDKPAVQCVLGLDTTTNCTTNPLGDVSRDGEVSMSGYARVRPTGWGLIIEEWSPQIMDTVPNFNRILFGTLAVGLLLGLVILLTGANRLAQPIQELVNQTQQLSRGEYSARVEGGTIDEMRALFQAFNEMADRVNRYRAGLERYVASVTQSQEDERKRIARELHDDTIQSLIALGRRLELLECSLENPINAAKQLYQLQQMLSNTIAEVRQFSRDLRPLLLEDLGLEAAMRQTLREMERREDMVATFIRKGKMPEGGLDGELEVSLYRIAQEAFSNVRKHAEATEVKVTLAYEEHEVQLTVCDNGKGFVPAETSDLARQGSFGLMGIRERTKLFGGNFEIQSTPGEGTAVIVSLPHTFTPDQMLIALQGEEESLPVITQG